MINLDITNDMPNLGAEFAYRQIGSIAMQVDPVDVSYSLEMVMEIFSENLELCGIPIERNGILIGILERSVVEKMNQSAWVRFWQKDLDAYIQAPLLSLRADDYIEKKITDVMELNHTKGVRFFAVFYRKSFFGIVGLREILIRVTELRNHDMEKARMVQQNLLSHTFVKKDPRYSVYTLNRMANEVGGDFYQDFAFPDGNTHIIGCFDVSGKNVAASLSTMAIGSFFTALHYFDFKDHFGKQTTVLMDNYIGDLIPDDTFITAALCYIDLTEGTVSIQNCGHTPIYIFIPGENRKVALKTINPNLPPLGMGIIQDEENTAIKIPITKGLSIVMYTDGLTDMVTPEGERYEEERTRNLLMTSYGKSEAETYKILNKQIDGWIADAMLADDITIMDIRFY